MSKTVVIGASSGLGRCIGVGLAKRGDQVALLARRRRANRECGQGGRVGRGRDRMRCHRRGVGAFGHRLRGGGTRRYRQPRLHAGDRTAGHRLVDTDADTWGQRVRHQRHRCGPCDGRSRSAPDRSRRARWSTSPRTQAPYGPPWPGLGAYGVSKAALEGSSRHGAPSIRTSGSPTSSSANAQAATATPPRDSTSAGTGSSPWSTTRSGFRVAACPAS